MRTIAGVLARTACFMLVVMVSSVCSAEVSVIITPPEAVEAGAKWRVDRGPWLASGGVATKLSAGKKLVEFMPLPEWREPAAFTVRNIQGYTNRKTVAYRPLPAFDLGEITGSRYGGPYKYSKPGFQKFANFGVFYGKGLFYSKNAALNRDLFFKSIRWYREHAKGFPHGATHQKYNYVVKDNGEIIVAIWSQNLAFNRLHEMHKCQPNHDVEMFTTPVAAGIMINYFPEDAEKVASNRSPCWIDIPSVDQEQKIGMLDAFNKHFILAQGVTTTEEVIKLYAPDVWVDTTVADAGEIHVNVEEATYMIDQSSGTYQPNPVFLDRVATLFAERLGVKPTLVKAYRTEPRRPVLSDPVASLPEHW